MSSQMSVCVLQLHTFEPSMHLLCVVQSYTMRNGILGVVGEMISQVLSGEDLDAKQKSTRDQFLDKLEVV